MKSGREGASVRRSRPDDVPLLIELRRQWTAENTGQQVESDPAFVAAFSAWHERESDQRVTWIAELGDVPVGMLNMLVFTRMPVPAIVGRSRPGQWGYVANVFVRPAHRNAGLGALLLDAAVRHADQHGYARLVLSPTERSVPFYARAGFAPATSLMVRPGTVGDTRPGQS